MSATTAAVEVNSTSIGGVSAAAAASPAAPTATTNGTAAAAAENSSGGDGASSNGDSAPLPVEDSPPSAADTAATGGGGGSGGGGNMSSEEYDIERIVDMRINSAGIKEYYLKWVGYDDKDNTWEPEHNLDCPDLIAAFEAERASKGGAKDHQRSGAAKKRKINSPLPQQQSAAPPTSNSTPPPAQQQQLGAGQTISAAAVAAAAAAAKNAHQLQRQSMDLKAGKWKTDKKVHGFDRGLAPEKIIGATDSSGSLMFLMKWQGTDEADLVPAKQANTKCPQVVIRFYEERLTWHSPSAHDDAARDKK